MRTLPPLVSAGWLAEHRDEVVVADVRWYLDGRPGREAHRAGHVPGAVWVDLNSALSLPASAAEGRHPLPDPESFAAGLAAVGIGDDTAVVAYDDAGGASAAARLVWMLRAVRSPAALLDGGLAAWTGPLETGDIAPAAARRTPAPWPAALLAGADDAARGPHVVDARAPERYAGETEPVDPRAGHIPGAVNVPFGDLLQDGRFKDPAALRARFAAAGIDDGAAAIVYCGSGVSACSVLIGLEAAGLGRGRLYPGSWSQWSSDPGRPAATGS